MDTGDITAKKPDKSRTRKSKEQVLADLKAVQAKRAAHIATLEKSVKEQDRKKRTKHLIDVGAEAEKYLGISDWTKEEVGTLFADIAAMPGVKTRLSRPTASQGADKTMPATSPINDTGIVDKAGA